MSDLEYFSAILDACGLAYDSRPYQHCPNCSPDGRELLGDRFRATFAPSDGHMWSLEVDGGWLYHTSMGAA